MSENFNTAVREIGSTRPRVRSRLKFSFQEFGGKRCCVLEDPLTSKFFRIGLSEYFFISFLDGKVTFDEAFARSSIAGGAESISEREALSLVSWLAENNLADFGTTTVGLLEEKAAKQQRVQWQKFTNLLFIKIPLFQPEAFLEKIYPKLRWVCGWPFFALWAALVSIALVQLVWSWDLFGRTSVGFLAPENWLWLGLIWTFLKVIHEFWHALLCKHYGGKVREAGLFLILFLPVGYVDATSSWGFPYKWQRMHVAAAGMFIELMIAAIAILVWSATDDGLVNHLAYNTAIMASVLTLLFNANPLMRFDGYYLLSDWLEMPNLSSNSQQMVTRLTKKWILGLPRIDLPDFRERETWILICYGVAAFIWKIIITLSIFIAASVMFKGLGLIIVLIALAGMAIPMLNKFYLYLKEGSGSERPVLKTVLPRLGGIALVLLIIAFFPMHPSIKSQAIIELGNLSIIRSQTGGFITKAHIQHKSSVRQDQLLVTLRDRDQEVSVEQLGLKIKAQEARSRLVYGEKDVAAYQSEAVALDALKKQFEERQADLDTLQVRAPADGYVVAPKLEQLVGTFIKPGQEILRVGNLPANELKILVPQEEVDAYRQHVDYPIEVKVKGRSTVYEAILKRVTARASREIKYPALTSAGGGSLPIVNASKEEKNSQREEAQTEMLDSYFEATALISGRKLIDLNGGEVARVRFSSREGQAVWYYLYSKASRALGRLIRTAESATDI